MDQENLQFHHIWGNLLAVCTNQTLSKNERPFLRPPSPNAEYHSLLSHNFQFEPGVLKHIPCNKRDAL